MPILEVGYAYDRARQNHVVSFIAREGKVEVSSGQQKEVDLATFEDRLEWCVDGSAHYCVNDEQFDHVLCERAQNGEILWVFYANLERP